jgi:hypothetical protein
MKSVPNLISYMHKFSWNCSQLLAICFELFSFGSVFNLENLLPWGPPVGLIFSLCAGPHVRTLLPPGDHAEVRQNHVALWPYPPVQDVFRLPERPLPRLPWLLTSSHHCAMKHCPWALPHCRCIAGAKCRCAFPTVPSRAQRLRLPGEQRCPILLPWCCLGPVILTVSSWLVLNQSSAVSPSAVQPWRPYCPRNDFRFCTCPSSNFENS